MRKRTLFFMCAIAMAATLLGMGVLATPNTPEIQLPIEGQCGNPITDQTRIECAVIVNKVDNVVTFQTEDGNLWEWEAENDLPENGYYCLFFDTLQTERIEDDEIVKLFVETN